MLCHSVECSSIDKNTVLQARQKSLALADIVRDSASIQPLAHTFRAALRPCIPRWLVLKVASFFGMLVSSIRKFLQKLYSLEKTTIVSGIRLHIDESFLLGVAFTLCQHANVRGYSDSPAERCLLVLPCLCFGFNGHVRNDGRSAFRAFVR